MLGDGEDHHENRGGEDHDGPGHAMEDGPSVDGARVVLDREQRDRHREDDEPERDFQQRGRAVAGDQ
jgi:hypothetical protein